MTTLSLIISGRVPNMVNIFIRVAASASGVHEPSYLVI